MATRTNKPSAKAVTAKKPSVKTVAKKPVKKTVKKVTAKAPATEQKYRTLRVTKQKQPFFSFKITRQTVYWTILVAFVIVMQLWILQAQYNVVQTTDELQQQLNIDN